MLKQIFEKLNPNDNHYDRGQIRLHASQQSLEGLDSLKSSLKHYDPDSEHEVRFIIAGQGQEIYNMGSDQIMNKKSITELLEGQWPDTNAKRNGNNFEFSITAPNTDQYKALFNQLHANLSKHDPQPNLYVELAFDKADFGIANQLKGQYLRLPEGSRYSARLETVNAHDGETEATYLEGKKLGEDEISITSKTTSSYGMTA